MKNKFCTWFLLSMMFAMTACGNSESEEIVLTEEIQATEESTTLDGGVALTNPFIIVENMDEVNQLTGFPVETLTKLPEGYEEDVICVIEGYMQEITYLNNNQKITFRKALGNQDISGDYNVYETEEMKTIGSNEITIKGNKEYISLATWITEDFSYSLSFTDCTITQLEEIILGIETIDICK